MTIRQGKTAQVGRSAEARSWASSFARITKNRLLLTTVGLALSTGACGTSKPSREEAAQMIRASDPFTSASVIRTIGLSRIRCILRPSDPDITENLRYMDAAAGAEHRGLIRVEMHPANEKECGWLFGHSSDALVISLTSEGQKARANWPASPVNDAYSELSLHSPDWNLPLQRRQFVDVTGIADPNPSTGEIPVEFKWQVIWPLGGKPNDKRGVATFRRYDTGWRIEKIEGLEVE